MKYQLQKMNLVFPQTYPHLFWKISGTLLFLRTNWRKTLELHPHNSILGWEKHGLGTAVNLIYRSILEELQKKGVIKNLNLAKNNNGKNKESDSDIIFHMANQSLMAGFSGRTLRKIPFIALSYSSLEDGMEKQELFKFMRKAILEESKEVDNLSFLGNNA